MQSTETQIIFQYKLQSHTIHIWLNLQMGNHDYGGIILKSYISLWLSGGFAPLALMSFKGQLYYWEKLEKI